jgi:serine protease AprX
VAHADAWGHGTHVAGIIARWPETTGEPAGTSDLADAGASIGHGAGFGSGRGMAPGVRLVSLRVLDAQGRGATSDVIEALQFAINTRERFGLRVVTLSLGHEVLEPAWRDPLVRAVEAAARAGLVVVVSAGNQGVHPLTGGTAPFSITSPGNAPSAITVGALDARGTAARGDDRIAPFSSRGPTAFDLGAKPDVVAPGRAVLSTASANSTLALSAPASVSGSSTRPYMRLNGTSMSAPAAAAVVALMVDAHRRAQGHAGEGDLTPNALKAMLQYAATSVRGPLGLQEGVMSQGTGAVNAAGAMALAATTDRSQPAGAYWQFGPLDFRTSFGGEEAAWARRIVWGGRTMLGDAIFQRLDAWAPALAWGGDFTGGTNVIWGDTLP